MTNEEAKQAKETVLRQLRDVAGRVAPMLNAIDERLVEYYLYCTDDEHDRANLYELLGLKKALRIFLAYPYDIDTVRKYIRKIEGEWDGGEWKSGGFTFDGRHVRLMPYQVWCIACIYGPLHDVDMGTPSRALLPSERRGEDGHIIDRRRITTEAHIFQTRKSGKTVFGASLDFLDFLFGDTNSQCLICANSRAQAEIAFKAIKDFAYQIDPEGKYIRQTAQEINWRPGTGRSASIMAMSAGGKTKDGLFGSMVHADEHGSANYVSGKSDMQSLVEVCWGSTGPRRQPLLIHTTTAGNVNLGPYQCQLDNVKEILTHEVERPFDQRYDDDWWFAFLLMPDQWEVTDNIEDLDREDIFAKVNHSIGITVQPDYYRRRIREARTKGEDTKNEVLTKDFNIWQSGRTQRWITPDIIQRLQTDTRIDDLSSDDGWMCYVGMDFSKGDDLNAQTYLCVRYNEQGEYEFFADLDSWISEDTLHNHTNSMLYKRLVERGDLHVSPGSTIDESLPTQRIIELSERLTIVRIGYDAYDAKRFINALRLWIVDEGGDPDAILRPVSQGFATYNSPTQELTYMVKNDPPLIHFSPNLMWPWQFGNCELAFSSDGNDNMKPVKIGGTAPGGNSGSSAKVDNVQCLCTAIVLYDEAEGTITNS